MKRDLQTLTFIEPTTRVTIVLIGCMHYNPASISLTQRIIETYSTSSSLSDIPLFSIIIECCKIRYQPRSFYFLELFPRCFSVSCKNSLTKILSVIKWYLLPNEMSTAKDLSLKYQIPLILGDQTITDTSKAIQLSLRKSFYDIFHPFSGGWRRIMDDYSEYYPLACPSAASSLSSSEKYEEYLNWKDSIDWKLLLGSPIAYCRYIFALFLRYPLLLSLPFLAYYLFARFSQYLPSQTTSSTSEDDLLNLSPGFHLFITFLTKLLMLLLLPLEFIIVSRMMFGPLLHDRNIYLAKNILRECHEAIKKDESNYKGYEKEEKEEREDSNTSNKSGLISSIGSSRTSGVLVDDNNRINGNDAELSPLLGNSFNELDSTFSSVVGEGGRNISDRSASAPGNRVVIAVLGMAHCNGIKKLLMEKLVTISNDHSREIAPALSSSTVITATSPVNIVDDTAIDEVINERQRNSSHSQ
jgi:hypothetical protein